MRDDPFLPLQRHPASRGRLPHRVTAQAALTADGGLRLQYRLRHGPALALPAPQPPGPADGLWRATCFEAFLGVEGEAAYREFNFSPAGQWAAYRFLAYRQRALAPLPAEALPVMDWRRAPGKLKLTVFLPRALLPPLPVCRWRLGLCAVIAGRNKNLYYWALRHPAATPDFHHPDGFALTLCPLPLP